MQTENNQNESIVDFYKRILSGEKKKFPAETWSPYKSGYDNARRCLRYLILEKLQLNRESAFGRMSMAFLKKMKLGGAMAHLFDSSPFYYFQYSFPEWELKPWEIKVTPKGTWSQETAKEAVRWMVNDRLKWNRADIVNKIKYQTFHQFHLSALIHKYFVNIFEICKIAFPEYNFKVWEFNFIQLNDEHKIEAVRWLIEEKLQYTKHDIKRALTKNDFIQNGMGKLLETHFDNSPFKALSFAYPKEDWSDLKRFAFGERAGTSKLTEFEVIEIRRKYAEGYKINQLRDEYVVSNDAITNIVRNASWARVKQNAE